MLVVHADAHYSVSRAAGILGLGTNQVIRVGLDQRRRMDVHQLEDTLRDLRPKNQPIVAVVACACSTPIGAFDPLDDVADVCRRHGVWLHVDAAHGGAACLSPRYRHLVAGLDRADSLVWDAHKMLFVPGLCAFVFYRNAAHKFEAFRQDAPYLFDPAAPGLAEFDSALRTVECTKRAAAFGLWGLWSLFGPQLFADLVDITFAMGRVFYEKLSAAPDFVPLHEPQCNIVVFRHVPAALRDAPPERLGPVPVGAAAQGHRVGRVLHRLHEARRRGGVARDDHQSLDHARASRPVARSPSRNGQALSGSRCEECIMNLQTMFILLCAALFSAISATAADADDSGFPAELVDFVPYAANPVFAGTGKDTWDRQIRERGYILKEGNLWRLWYTGYNDRPNDVHHTTARYLGYVTSPDGLKWTRYADRPIFDAVWTEDVHITRWKNLYRMFAEGRDDIMHWLTSKDGIQWQEHGPVDIRYADGEPLTPGPYGTPCAWGENGKWHLFYERKDQGIWLAASTNGTTWVNVQDAPVISIGVEPYDKYAVALNQVVKIGGKYFAYYHGNADPHFKGPWTTSVAMSTDLVHWKKYPNNPVIRTDHSSAILVNNNCQYRMYTMHPDVWAWFPRTKPSKSGSTTGCRCFRRRRSEGLGEDHRPGRSRCWSIRFRRRVSCGIRRTNTAHSSTTAPPSSWTGIGRRFPIRRSSIRPSSTPSSGCSWPSRSTPSTLSSAASITTGSACGRPRRPTTASAALPGRTARGTWCEKSRKPARSTGSPWAYTTPGRTGISPAIRGQPHRWPTEPPIGPSTSSNSMNSCRTTASSSACGSTAISIRSIGTAIDPATGKPYGDEIVAMAKAKQPNMVIWRGTQARLTSCGHGGRHGALSVMGLAPQGPNGAEVLGRLDAEGWVIPEAYNCHGTFAWVPTTLLRS